MFAETTAYILGVQHPAALILPLDVDYRSLLLRLLLFSNGRLDSPIAHGSDTSIQTPAVASIAVRRASGSAQGGFDTVG